MSVVKLDLADGTTFSQSFQQYQAIRVAEVSELSGPPSKIITDAIDDPRLPAMGDPHPVYAGMFVTNKTARPVDAKSARVILPIHGISRISASVIPAAMPPVR